MENKQISSHDKFFKSLFSNKEDVKEFIVKIFPTELSKNIQLETLELDTTEYIDSRLKTNFSDIVYNCNYGKDKKIKVSLLFEHKSYSEAYPHFQLMGYMLNIWQKQIKQKKELMPIVPIIFYHGKQNWDKKSFNEYFNVTDGVLQNFIPKFDYLLIDTSQYTDSQIQDLFENIELQIGLLILKNIYNEQKLLEELTNIFAKVNELLETEEGERFFETTISYLYYSTKIETKKFAEKMRTVSPQAKHKFESTAMRLLREGRVEGLMEGFEKVAFSMLQKQYPDDDIIELTGISQQRLNYLKTLKEYKID